jgi:hypothetical protein
LTARRRGFTILLHKQRIGVTFTTSHCSRPDTE